MKTFASLNTICQRESGAKSGFHAFPFAFPLFGGGGRPEPIALTSQASSSFPPPAAQTFLPAQDLRFCFPSPGRLGAHVDSSVHQTQGPWEFQTRLSLWASVCGPRNKKTGPGASSSSVGPRGSTDARHCHPGNPRVACQVPGQRRAAGRFYTWGFQERTIWDIQA